VLQYESQLPSKGARGNKKSVLINHYATNAEEREVHQKELSVLRRTIG
jgi:hypothetical protein